MAGQARTESKKQGKHFFREKKKQKTFMNR
jgi:hypothetical protein